MEMTSLNLHYQFLKTRHQMLG